MIHTRVTRTSEGTLDGIHISVTSDSLANFLALVDRALNCWDSAPAELKELGDMLTHGSITQDHSFTPINSTRDSNSEYMRIYETALVQAFIDIHGVEAWRTKILDGTWNDVLKKGA